MNEYTNLTVDNIDEEHICCAIGDPKHQDGVNYKKEWIKQKLKDGHVFRKLNARGKMFIEYEPIETAWAPVSGENYEYIYCLWVAGSFKGKGIGKELLEYAINDSRKKGKSGICTLVSKKKKPFLGEKKFFEHFGFKVVDNINDYELVAPTLKNAKYIIFIVMYVFKLIFTLSLAILTFIEYNIIYISNEMKTVTIIFFIDAILVIILMCVNNFNLHYFKK